MNLSVFTSLAVDQKITFVIAFVSAFTSSHLTGHRKQVLRRCLHMVNPGLGKGSGRIQTIGMVHIAVDGVILQIRSSISVSSWWIEFKGSKMIYPGIQFYKHHGLCSLHPLF